MAYIKGTATFTNGSATVTSVSLNQGVISLVSSGTNLVVGFNPVIGNIEATGTNGTDITLRNVWSGTTGSYEFVAFDTIEGLTDAVQSARGFSTALQDALNTIGTPSTTVTPDSIAKRDSAGRLESATGVSGNDVLTFGNVQTSATDSTAGRVLTVGAGGWLGNSPQTSADLNTLITPSNYFINSNQANAPTSSNGHLQVTKVSDSVVKQCFTEAATSRTFIRVKATDWKPWQELYHTGNLELQTSATDATAGRVLTVGAFGLGALGSENLKDLNAPTVPDGCNFRFVTNPTNAPSNFTIGGYLIDMGSSGTASNSQILSSNTTNKCWYRGSQNLSWQELYHTGNTGNVVFNSPTVSGSVISISSSTAPERIRFIKDSNSISTVRCEFINSNGQVGTIATNGTSTSYNTSSDNRLKDVIGKPSDEEINAKFNDIFDAFTCFNWKNNPDDDPVWGFLAHDVIDKGLDFGSEGEGPRDLEIGDVYEQATYDEDGNEIEPEKTVTPAGVDQSKVVPYLVAKIEQLERRLAELENK